ncbi:MAG TPA: DegT/DnrJ/EryC1/StrS aminotransferase family protein [Dehalococcoidia bacterium]|nr:DegT/DnrJ/EryC1/StrS aminotransferase family protein [Dehalococcoidia bacterium]
MEFMPLTRPFIGEEEEREVIDTLRSGWLATGPKTERFEREFAAYLGRKHALGTNSCTAALHLGLLALGIGAGDEVITTPMTFVATANSIVYTGARPVFVDVEPDTLNIDPRRIADAITERTKAILLVHLYGHPCEMDEIMDIATRFGLKVIGDCAHAIEAEYKGRKVGSLGHVDCFSFYTSKNLTTGNGGMLVTDDIEVATLAQCLRDHGMSPGAWARYRTGEFRHYEMTRLGFKCIMWDVQAALGLQQLRRLEKRHHRRLEIARWYEALLQPLNAHLEILRPRSYVKHSYHIYAIKIKGVDRDRVAHIMEEKGIGVGVHYRPVHLEPFYRQTYGHCHGEFPVAEDAAAGLLSLPFWPEMTEEDVHRVVETLKDAVLAS